MHIWSEFCKIVPVENIAYVIESPIWYNSHIGHGRLFFLKNRSDLLLLHCCFTSMVNI